MFGYVNKTMTGVYGSVFTWGVTLLFFLFLFPYIKDIFLFILMKLYEQFIQTKSFLK